jgi:hypothetical protein
MMRLLFCTLALLFLSTSAFADIDHRCLNSCISQSIASATCREQCSYNAKAPASSMTMDASRFNDHHKELIAPVPSEELLLIPPKPTSKPKRVMDYICLDQCVKAGTQFSLCEERCDKNVCKAGKKCAKNKALPK